MKKLKSLSVFFPFWNEEKNVERVVTSALGVIDDLALKWEIIIIDDGSTDKTLKVAETFALKNKNVRVITHQPNRGYGAALKAGFENSQYDYILFTDGDGQFDFAESVRFVEAINNADMVIGFRKKRRDHNIAKRLLLMSLLKVWDWLLFRFHFKDIDCGFKMFTRHALEEISPLRSEGAMITTEILAKATRKKLKITEIGVEHYQRQFGMQTGANLPVIVRAVLESLILWWDIRNRRI